MTVEAQPYGLSCNLKCVYCYQNSMRESLVRPKPDYPKIKRRLMEHGTNFTLFGGEPLMTPVEELEELWSWGLQQFKCNGIQTNGTLITPHHMRLFRRYNVHVGFSIDGPGKLNAARCAEKRTAVACMALENCITDPVIRCSLIVTLHRVNGSKERRPEFLDWLNHLCSLGLKDVRIHLLENDCGSTYLKLTDDEILDIIKDLETVPMEFDIIKETLSQLKTGGGGSCVYLGCDQMSTTSVQAVGPDGELYNCGRTNKAGIDYLKHPRPHNTRSIILQNTRQEDGGCKDCPFWFACSGYCPGTAIDGDWRNRTEYCSFLKKLFEYFIEKYNIQLVRRCGEHQDSPHLDTHGDTHGDQHIDSWYHTDTPHLDSEHVDKSQLPVIEVRHGHS